MVTNARFCACGRRIPIREDYGPVVKIGSMKFYENSSLIGHPTSRQQVDLCDKHSTELIEFLRLVKLDAPEEVPG